MVRRRRAFLSLPPDSFLPLKVGAVLPNRARRRLCDCATDSEMQKDNYEEGKARISERKKGQDPFSNVLPSGGLSSSESADRWNSIIPVGNCFQIT